MHIPTFLTLLTSISLLQIAYSAPAPETRISRHRSHVQVHSRHGRTGRTGSWLVNHEGRRREGELYSGEGSDARTFFCMGTGWKCPVGLKKTWDDEKACEVCSRTLLESVSEL